MTTDDRGRTPKYSSTNSSTAAPQARKGEREGPQSPSKGFTEGFILALKHGPKRYEVFDKKERGLCIRVAAEPGDAKSWVWYAVDEHGKRRNVQLGRWPAVSVEDARAALADKKKAKEEGRLAALLDPAPAAVGALTFAKVAEDYFKTQIAGRRREAGQARARAILDNDILPAIGHLEVATLRVADLELPTARAVGRGAKVHAAAVLQVTKAISRYAARRGAIPYDLSAPLRASDLEAETTSQRSRALNDEELPLLLAALHRMRFPKENERDTGARTATLLRILLTTGVRTGELLHAPWSEFDLDAGVWTIPPGRQKLTLKGEKKARPWRVPLAPSVVAMLRSLQDPGPKSKWVAASSCDSKDGKVTDKVLARALRRLQGLDTPTVRQSKARAAARAADDRVRPGPRPGAAPRLVLPGGQVNPHDFRRTLRAWLQDQECPLDVGERILGHSLAKLGGVMGVYARSDLFDKRKAWLERWADHLDTVEATAVGAE